MAKWNYVFLIKWFLHSLILLFGCSADEINSDVCLKTPFDFASRTACKFSLQDAKNWFESETGDCLKECHVNIINLENLLWSNRYERYFIPNYQLESLALSFNGLSENLMIINTSCNYSIRRKRSLKIICSSSFENALDVSKDFCTTTKRCEDENKTCSLKGQIGVCMCNPGYIGFENKCFKGNLTLNGTCKRNEQCSMVFGSVCQNNTCVCGPGYKPFNESKCLLHSEKGDSEARAMESREDSVVGLMGGAVVGGLFLGIVLTVLGVIVYKNIRYGKPKAGKKQDQKVEFFNNTSYETESETHQNHSSAQSTNERKIVNVPPFAHSMDLPVTENTYTHHGNKSLMVNSHDVNDDVYNHLHEKEEDSDSDETYDHAHENINRTTEDCDYSNLNTGRHYMRPGVSATEDNDYDERELHGDYCSLENQ